MPPQPPTTEKVLSPEPACEQVLYGGITKGSTCSARDSGSFRLSKPTLGCRHDPASQNGGARRLSLGFVDQRGNPKEPNDGNEHSVM